MKTVVELEEVAVTDKAAASDAMVMLPRRRGCTPASVEKFLSWVLGKRPDKHGKSDLNLKRFRHYDCLNP